MHTLLLHPDTKQELERFILEPTHAIMLLAPDGSGKRHVADNLAAQLLGSETTIDSAEHPSIFLLAPVNKTISIDAIRGVQKHLQLKTIGKRPIRRVVIIEAAQRMTTEAQNALLKMLEEPSVDTVFILTAPSAHSVLPTIYSRTQHIMLKNPSQEALMSYFRTQNHNEPAVQKVLQLSGGRLGLAHALLNKSEEHPLLVAVEQARHILGSNLFIRLGLVDEWSRQKEELPDRLDTLERLCQAGLKQAADKNDMTLTRRWQRYRKAVYEAKASLGHNPNTKLLLTNLFLRLS